jgi:hypothetical protein
VVQWQAGVMIPIKAWKEDCDALDKMLEQFRELRMKFDHYNRKVSRLDTVIIFLFWYWFMRPITLTLFAFPFCLQTAASDRAKGVERRKIQERLDRNLEKLKDVQIDYEVKSVFFKKCIALYFIQLLGFFLLIE